VVQHLLEKGADIKAKNGTDYCVPNQLILTSTKKGGNTSLGLAASHGHLPVIEYLLNAGADINAINNQGQTALHFAVANGHYLIVEFLVKKDALLHGSVEFAAKFGFLEILKFLLREGAPLESKRLIGTVALNFAAEEGHLEIVKYLLEKEESDDLLTIFHAAKGGDYDTLQYLLSRKKVYLDSCDLKKEYIPLHASIEKGHLESVKLLVEAGANVNNFTGCAISSVTN
jgi:ankyrin repeat protein